MTFTKIRDSVIPIITVILIIGSSIGVIAYGRGYRLDIIKKSIKPTGLLAATSDPNGAQIIIDGKLTSATNNTINIAPGIYNVAIAKEGYQTWEKKIKIQGEVVSRADAYLFPTNPSLSAITTNGVASPALSPDGSKLAYVIPQAPTASETGILSKRPGIWVLDMADRPLSLNRDARQITKSDMIDFSGAILFWSPDSKEIVATVTNLINKTKTSYLLESDKLNDLPLRINNLTDTKSQWDEMSLLKEKEKISGLPSLTSDAVSKYMKIVSFSPDETKILYEASISGTIPQIINPPLIGSNNIPETRTIKNGNVYVYDIKEDRNYSIGDAKDLLPIPSEPVKATKPTPSPMPFSQPYIAPTLQWIATNRHLLFVTKGKIEVMDYDATNRKTIYSGPFWDNFVVPWTNASKILILTTLNATTGFLPNLYAVNLR
jgi:hypothetical protein